MKFRPLTLVAVVILIGIEPQAHAADNLQIASSNIGSSDTPEIVALQLGYFHDAGLNVTILMRVVEIMR